MGQDRQHPLTTISLPIEKILTTHLKCAAVKKKLYLRKFFIILRLTMCIIWNALKSNRTQHFYGPLHIFMLTNHEDPLDSHGQEA